MRRETCIHYISLNWLKKKKLLPNDTCYNKCNETDLSCLSAWSPWSLVGRQCTFLSSSSCGLGKIGGRSHGWAFLHTSSIFSIPSFIMHLWKYHHCPAILLGLSGSLLSRQHSFSGLCAHMVIWKKCNTAAFQYTLSARTTLVYFLCRLTERLRVWMSMRPQQSLAERQENIISPAHWVGTELPCPPCRLRWHKPIVGVCELLASS